MDDGLCLNSDIINLNVDLHGYITPFRGLRQGDPLFPYLFLLCAKGLTNLLIKAERNGNLTDIKISRHYPPITRLLFTDDLYFL